MAENPPAPAPAIDPGRLRRAVHLDAERVPGGAWSVSGGRSAHTVSADGSACDCTDYGMRGAACKHILRVKLAAVDAGVLGALRELVPRLARSNDDYRCRIPTIDTARARSHSGPHPA